MAPSRASLARLTATLCRDQQRKLYHSHQHPPPAGPFNHAEQAILSAAYSHVPEHGFSQQALILGARDAGYLDISTTLLPDGPFSLVCWHLLNQREALAPRSAAVLASEQPIDLPARIERLTWARLCGNRHVNHRWQEALAVMAQPTHVPASLHELALLSDEIHHLAGDKSVDPSWYTKRAGLSMIYASSELFMTNDRSPQFADTRAFLQRRLAEAGTLSGTVGSVARWMGFTASATVNVLRSKGLGI